MKYYSTANSTIEWYEIICHVVVCVFACISVLCIYSPYCCTFPEHLCGISTFKRVVGWWHTLCNSASPYQLSHHPRLNLRRYSVNLLARKTRVCKNMLDMLLFLTLVLRLISEANIGVRARILMTHTHYSRCWGTGAISQHSHRAAMPFERAIERAEQGWAHYRRWKQMTRANQNGRLLAHSTNAILSSESMKI